MKEQVDRFSDRSPSYAKFRPTYPEEFYTFLFSKVLNFEKAWDCGTGNGQVAIRLADRFKNVIATDLSRSQIDHAFPKKNIRYSVTRSESTSFADDSFDLITVGQALHWFDFNAFYKEVIRVARHHALVAVWGYGLLTVTPEVDEVINRFYQQITHPYWDPERSHIDESYKNIPFPFDEIAMPDFAITIQWKAEDLIGFLTSWSAVSNYIKAKGESPLPLIEKDLKEAWEQDEDKEVSFPMFGKFGYVKK